MFNCPLSGTIIVRILDRLGDVVEQEQQAKIEMTTEASASSVGQFQLWQLASFVPTPC